MNNQAYRGSINYKKIVKRFLSFKYYYLGLAFILLLIAFVNNKYKTRTYQNNTTLLVKLDDKSSFLTSNNFNVGAGSLFENSANIDNEQELIKSYTLIKNTIDRLNLKTNYYTINNKLIYLILDKLGLKVYKNLYNDSPISLVVNTSSIQLVNADFFVEIIDGEYYRLKVKTKEDSYLYDYLEGAYAGNIFNYAYENTHSFGEEIITDYFSFSINKIQDIGSNFSKKNILFFRFNDLNRLALDYRSRLSIEPTSPTSTLLKINLQGENKECITDFLNELSLSYLNKDIDEKGKKAINTIRFIESQIEDISDSLSYAESNLKQFRTANNVLDLSFQGQQFFEKLEELENEKVSLSSQKRYYNYLLDYIKENSEVADISAPSSANVIDPILTNLISKLLDLNAERMAIENGTSATKNLYLSDLILQIDNLQKTIIENVSNNLKNIDITIKENDFRISKITNQISELPKTELQLLGIERNFNLNDALYTFLLQKRSEAQIARASTFPDYEIVEQAQVILAKKTSPNSTLNYALAFLLALLAPTFVIMVVDFFDNTISEKDEIKDLVDLPILGNIYHNDTKEVKVMINSPQSPVSESFRALRTNFNFMLKSEQSQIILLTSSFSGEGKTFNSINLALSFASNGHRTVLLEFDLRRPKIHGEFSYKNEIGITSYLIGQANYQDIIKHTAIDNFDLITSGPIPPNPSELTSSKATLELFQMLRENYDFIVVDSAPVGVVSDTFILMNIADMNLFVVRNGKTVKEAMNNTINKIKTNKIDNVAMLVNDVDAKKESTKYGYDSKYYHVGKANKVLQILKKMRGRNKKEQQDI